MSSKITKKDIVKTISAPPDFWAEVDAAALEAGSIGRSAFVRLAVTDYLKDGGVSEVLTDGQTTEAVPA